MAGSSIVIAQNDLTEKEIQAQAEIDSFCIKCMYDFEYFSETCLKIKTKTEGLKPLLFNEAQLYLDKIANKISVDLPICN